MAEFCWLAQFSQRPCEGRSVRVHLIPRQLLRKKFPRGVWRPRQNASWRPVRRGELVPKHPTGLYYRSPTALYNDPRGWVWACGGPMGDSGHHGQLDRARTLRVPRLSLPPGLEEFARELGIDYWLDREYGELAA